MMACSTDVTTFPGYCTVFIKYFTVGHPIYPLEKTFQDQAQPGCTVQSSWHSKVKGRSQGQRVQMHNSSAWPWGFSTSPGGVGRAVPEEPS